MIVAVLNGLDMLRFRLRNGFWCPHTTYEPWQMINGGAGKIRFCRGCSRMESL